jgi:ABC-2 type transport system ATP-binding protein
VRRRIGYVPQLISADAALSGRENLSLFAKLYGVARSEGAGRIDEGLAFMGLADELLVADASWGLVFAARDVSHTDRAPANHRHLLGD